MTVCSGLQGSENKTACKALKNQLQLTGFPVLEIKTEFPFGKLWEKGLITYFVFELPFSPKESIYFSLPLEDFFFHPIFPLGGNYWKTDCRHPLVNRHPETNTVTITFPNTAAMQSIQAVSWKEGHHGLLHS